MDVIRKRKMTFIKSNKMARLYSLSLKLILGNTFVILYFFCPNLVFYVIKCQYLRIFMRFFE